MRAPTAANRMLCSIVHVADQGAKETLARTRDNQPFIARGPLVLLFLADWQRWYDVVDSACLVDEQRIGPYRFWYHEHIFQTVEDGGLMTGGRVMEAGANRRVDAAWQACGQPEG